MTARSLLFTEDFAQKIRRYNSRAAQPDRSMLGADMPQQEKAGQIVRMPEDSRKRQKLLEQSEVFSSVGKKYSENRGPAIYEEQGLKIIEKGEKSGTAPGGIDLNEKLLKLYTQGKMNKVSVTEDVQKLESVPITVFSLKFCR